MIFYKRFVCYCVDAVVHSKDSYCDLPKAAAPATRRERRAKIRIVLLYFNCKSTCVVELIDDGVILDSKKHRFID
jgi:hypothetical protein